MAELFQISNFDYKRSSDDWVLSEARRCLACFDPPCQEACPAAIPIPEFIRSINSGNLPQAASLVRQANPMAAICGAVCPQEVYCQNACTRGKIDRPLAIRNLHGFATKYEILGDFESGGKNKRIAIIGAGPAGLSCAVKLDEANYNVAVFESKKEIGGIPNFSIPKFRLPDQIIKIDLDYVSNYDIDLISNYPIVDPQSLLDGFDAVFIASGLHQCRRLDIRGENSPEVTDALSFLEKARSGEFGRLEGRRVVIVGGGNVSLDVAATACELGALETRLLYRRGPQEMKVWRSEIEEAQQRGVIIEYLVTPIEIVSEKGVLKSVKCMRMKLGDDLDSSKRKISVPIPHSEFAIPADLVIVAVGLTSNFGKQIRVNSDLSTSIPGIFAGGDWARGEGTIVEAVRDGKAAADSIIKYLGGK
jgi:NADPH-dependent glutamate synthase beta subunit-like oxidoreductase